TGMQGLGDLPGGAFGSEAWKGVSNDGSMVAGNGHTGTGSGEEGFRWVEGMGMEGLGLLPGTSLSGIIAFDMSGDGSVIVGSLQGDQLAFIWDETHGMRLLQ